MDLPPEYQDRRVECLQGVWWPVGWLGEDHFFGLVRITHYVPGPLGYSTAIVYIGLWIQPRPTYLLHTPPLEIIEIMSDDEEDVPMGGGQPVPPADDLGGHPESPQHAPPSPEYVPDRQSMCQTHLCISHRRPL